MCSKIPSSILLVLVAVATATSILEQNLLVYNTLPDGEVELRVRYRGITAKEISVGGHRQGVKFRQVTNGKQLLQLIFDENDELTDCEIVHEPHRVAVFLSTFKNDLSDLHATSNVTVETLLENKLVAKNIRKLTGYSRWRKLCKRKHIEARKVLQRAEEIGRNVTRSLEIGRSKRSMVVPGTLWCGHSNAATKYTQLGLMSRTDKCCRRHDYCKQNIPGFSQKFGYYNYSPFTISHCFCDNRRRRDLSDIFRVPGTKWCGKGYSAGKYTHLGGFSRTDRCCRKHDTSCPFWIAGFQTKYGLFNWRVNTIMHCSCDERFRACLKMVDTSDANLVGKLFFNMVQTKCFVLKPKKICLRRSWWGKCEKRKYVKRAVLRDNIPY